MNETTTSPRHSVKARRKQKEEDVETPPSMDESWRRKYEAAVRKRRSPPPANGNLSPSSPLSAATLSDMEFLLAPSIDDTTGGGGQQQPNTISHNQFSSSSADSIIRRVEAEIAAARKSAALAQHRTAEQLDNDDDDDMAHILNTNNTFSDQHTTASSNDDSSKRRALEEIRDEFRDHLIGTGVELPNHHLRTMDPPPPTIRVEKKEEETHPFEEKKEEKPSTPTGSIHSPRMIRLLASPKDSPKKRSTLTEPTRRLEGTVLPEDVSTPTRANIGRRAIAEPAVLSPRSISHPEPVVEPVVDGGAAKDPDGEYSETNTPPRKSVPVPTRASPTQAQSPAQTRSPAMNKTRLLLDSLKQQRQSLPGKAPTPPLPVSPRSPAANQFFARARGSLAPRSPSSNQEPTSPYSSPKKESPRRALLSEEINEVNKATESTTTDSMDGTPNSEQSRRIRFRNPFPVLKPPTVHRDLEDIVRDHKMDLPELQIRPVKPKQELKQLIVAAMGTSLPRRSNACGALKVLTRHEKNQMSLVRTDGFLQALTHAASQSVLGDVDLDLAIDARTRAVTCLKNVCGPKDNRILILTHPGVVETLLKVVQQDDGAGRAMAAAALALLAKTPQCREHLAQVEGLIDTLAKVMHSAATMISEEAMVVRQSFSPRSSSGRRAQSEQREKEELALDSSMKENEEEEEDGDRSHHDDEGASIITDESSLSSRDGDSKQHRDIELVKLDTVDSIRNQTEGRYDEFVNQSRCNSCAALLHISKQCATSHELATNQTLLSCVVAVAREVEHPIHSKCLEILSNLSRLAANNRILTRFDGLVETLVAAANASKADNRIFALRTLQNLSADAGSKTLLANRPGVLHLLTSCAMRKDMEEKDLAIATLYNLTTEPGAVTAMTNTKNVVATLVHLAHSPDSSSHVRLLACDALATLSLWLQTWAGTGMVPDGVVNVPLPSQKTTGWDRWD